MKKDLNLALPFLDCQKMRAPLEYPVFSWDVGPAQW